jgi:hypothetical protein
MVVILLYSSDLGVPDTWAELGNGVDSDGNSTL